MATQPRQEATEANGDEARAKSSAASVASDLEANLRRLERAFEPLSWSDRRALARARRRARGRSLKILEASGDDRVALRTALLTAAGELLLALRDDPCAADGLGSAFARSLVEATDMPAIALAREVLRSPELTRAPAEAAIEFILTTTLAFAPLRAVSVWGHDRTARLTCLGHAGARAPSRRERRTAAQVLAGVSEQAASTDATGLLVALPVGRAGRPTAVLVGCARPSSRRRAHAYLEEAEPTLAAVLERDALRSEDVAAERALAEARERKLTRLGFDLHDGPIQDVAVLGQDVRLFRDQLELLRGPISENKLVGGRIEDLEAQLVSLDNELRRLAREAQTASALPERPFPAAIRERIQAFTARTRIRPRLALEGDMGLVSPSQQIALLKVLQEALANVREHAEASAVTVRVSASGKKIAAEIRDDGRGFDVERTLRRTARDGRMGLTSMNERIHLLGGRSQIDSRPGGPTVVSVVLDRWLPARADPRPSAPERTAPRRRATKAPGRRGRTPRPAGDDPGAV